MFQVEIRLMKGTGVRWDSLEGKEQAGTSQRVYPSSNRSRNPVDWDKVEAEVTWHKGTVHILIIRSSKCQKVNTMVFCKN